MHCNTVVNGQKEKPIFVGMGFIGDSEFLILRIETDCNAGKIHEETIAREEIFSLVLQLLQCRKSGPVRSETGPENTQKSSFFTTRGLGGLKPHPNKTVLKIVSF